ncbi:MAG TPA: hypothetical protein VEG08_14065 [Terriglobales bacterium]|nr:hypothetical protein [Terriglobales bacterium]
MTAAALPFLCGLGLALAACLATFLYLRPPLLQILEDLCGNHARARFWAAFSGIAVVFVPLIFALHMRLAAGAGEPFVFTLARQLEWAFAGLVLSVLLLGWVIGRFIPRETPRERPDVRKPPSPAPVPRQDEAWRDSWSG